MRLLKWELRVRSGAFLQEELKPSQVVMFAPSQLESKWPEKSRLWIHKKLRKMAERGGRSCDNLGPF